jgi:hypothetical protein
MNKGIPAWTATTPSTSHRYREHSSRAAEYVRMSTDHQQYSTQNQADKIREYAERHGIEIVRTYADEGRKAASTSMAAMRCNA